MMTNGIRIWSAVFPQCTGQTDRQTSDRSRESLITIGRCAPRATRPRIWLQQDIRPSDGNGRPKHNNKTIANCTLHNVSSHIWTELEAPVRHAQMTNAPVLELKQKYTRCTTHTFVDYVHGYQTVSKISDRLQGPSDYTVIELLPNSVKSCGQQS